MTWEESARCRQHDPEIFFAPGVRSERKAKAICGRCPVSNDCLLFALESQTDFGIWGGMNGKERRRLVRRTKVAGEVRIALDREPARTPVSV